MRRIFALILLLIAACTPAEPTRIPDALTVFAPQGLVPDALLDGFAGAFGVLATLTTYTTRAELDAAMQTGGYDLIIARDDAVEALRVTNLLQPLNLAQIPDRDRLDAAILSAYTAGDQTHSLPYAYMTFGVVRLPDAPVIAAWSDLTAADVPLAVTDDARVMLGGALVALGFAADDTTHLSEARDWWLSRTVTYIGTAPDTALIAGDAVLGVVDSAAAQRTLEAVEGAVYVPLTGALFYEMAIPRSALRPATALAFINYSLDPVNSLLITDATRLPSPNRAAVERMAQAVPELWALYENSPAFNPPASVLDAGVPLIDADAEAAALIESLWSEVVANFTSPSQ